MSFDEIPLFELQRGAGRAVRLGRPLRGKGNFIANESPEPSPTGPVGATGSTEAKKVP